MVKDCQHVKYIWGGGDSGGGRNVLSRVLKGCRVKEGEGNPYRRNIDAGDSPIEAESAQDYFVLPIWSSYTSTVKSSKAGEEPTKHSDFQQVDKEDQVFLDELERLKRYIRVIPNGNSAYGNYPEWARTPHPMIMDPPPTDSTIVPAPRKKLDSEFSEEENKLEMADTQAEIILSQGLPRHIFNNLNQTSTAKEIWDNVEMLMQGSGRTIQQRKEDLFDEYERFRAIGNESIHDYFVRFHKLVNDMKITQLNIQSSG
ncbi:hypothetical protein Tco_0212826 [Tanacetum coccineum]